MTVITAATHNDDEVRKEQGPATHIVTPLEIPQVYDNVYGQNHPIETPELLEEKVLEFNKAVEQLVQSNKALEVRLAQEKCPELLSFDFKLIFLRCEVFHVNRAANRYAKYWKKRVATFGPVKAFLQLTADGAMKGDDDALRIHADAMTEITETKDYLGRRVLFSNYARFKPTDDVNSRLRAFWYVMHQALEDEETQKYGVVFMVYSGKKMKLRDYDMNSTRQCLDSVQGCIPVRLAAFHVCFPLAIFKPVVSVMKMFMSPRLRKRIFLHDGSFEQVQQRLSSPYGLDKELYRCHDHRP